MQEHKIRKSAVAGQFYAASPQGLKEQIRALIDKKADKIDVIACMLPHAGYMYSGRVAAATIASINIKDKIILLGPNHTGNGSPYSIMTEGVWQTPLGEVAIDAELAKKLLDDSRYLESDTLAHRDEHSLEVELPILQYFKSSFQIVPIAFLSSDYGVLKDIGSQIGNAVKDSGTKDAIMMVASSDMTHYEPYEEAQAKDRQAIEAILELDEDNLMNRIARLDISMCGYAPVAVMLKAAKVLGAKNAKLIRYETSGDITGDKDSVVGYAGIIIY